MKMLKKMSQWSNGRILAVMFGISGILLCIGLIVAWLLGPAEEEVLEKKVAVTIFPLYDVVNELTGDLVEVNLVLPPGESPHTFDLTARQAVSLQNSDMLFEIGHGLDNWIVESDDGLNIKKVVVVDKNIELIEDNEENAHGGNADPHYWLSVPNTLIIALNIKDELIDNYPEFRDEITSRYENYVTKLLALDKTLRTEINKLENKNIATYHSAWKYFARDYGINIVSSYEESGGVQPGPEKLANFISTVKNKHVRAIFTEPQFDDSDVASTARDAGVMLSVLDPIGGVEGRMSYISLMEFNLMRIVNAK